MKTYTLDQLSNFSSEQIDQIQQGIDNDISEYLAEHEEELSILKPREMDELKGSYTNTMENLRLLQKAIVACFKTESSAGYPEFIYNIDLSDGSIETNKNGRRTPYYIRHLAPCTTAMLHYVDGKCNDVFVIIPPIKSEERTIEKILLECKGEFEEARSKELSAFERGNFEEEPELPFFTKDCKLLEAISDNKNKSGNNGELANISKLFVVPRDIYRLTVTSKYPGDLEELIENFEKKFPEFIKFENGERNSYKKDISENSRIYYDIKKTAKITNPETKKSIFVEFQFKQNCMFFAHIRSHAAYEKYRILEAKYKKAVEQLKKKKDDQELKNRVKQLEKQMEEARQLCINIHKSAVHQSNFYLMHKLFWLEENARGLHEDAMPMIKEELKKNYIVESREPFDGATAFITNQDEWLNKSYYLKMIGALPESFDEFGKNAKIHINKEWANLADTELTDFQNITAMAIKYQPLIRKIQKQGNGGEELDANMLLNLISQNDR